MYAQYKSCRDKYIFYSLEKISELIKNVTLADERSHLCMRKSKKKHKQETNNCAAHKSVKWNDRMHLMNLPSSEGTSEKEEVFFFLFFWYTPLKFVLTVLQGKNIHHGGRGLQDLTISGFSSEERHFSYLKIFSYIQDNARNCQLVCKILTNKKLCLGCFKETLTFKPGETTLMEKSFIVEKRDVCL